MSLSPADPRSFQTIRSTTTRPPAPAGDDDPDLRQVEPRLVRARDILCRVGLRITLPRLRVLTLFLDSPRKALSADAVMRRLIERGDKASLSSVYSSLRQLEEAGLLASRFDDGRRVYEEAGSLPQARIVCLASGEERVFQDAALDALIRRIVREQGFDVSGYKLLVEGVSNPGPGCRHS